MTAMDRNPLLLLVAGFTIWSLAFVLLYALQALGCAYDWPFHRPILILAYLACLAPLAWLAWPRSRGNEQLEALPRAALWANRGALAAGILVFLPVTFTSTCF